MIVSNRAVFIDKDGTLVENVPYNVDPDRLRLASGASEAMAFLRAASYRVFVISNQSGVARGYFAEEDLKPVQSRLGLLLAEAGISLSGFYYCPHHPEGTVPGYDVACLCRKPAPGLILQAARDHDIDLENSWVVGDILDDIEAGRRSGCRTVLVNNGNETQWLLNSVRMPQYIVNNLIEAALIIGSAEPDVRPGGKKVDIPRPVHGH